MLSNPSVKADAVMLMSAPIPQKSHVATDVMIFRGAPVPSESHMPVEIFMIGRALSL